MRTAGVILLLLISSAVSLGQEHKERAAPTPQPVVPSGDPVLYPLRYTSPEGRYTVSLPAEPTLSSQNAKTPSGASLTQHMAMVADRDGMLMVAYFDYAADIQFSLDQGRDGMVKSINGTLLDEQAISLGGAPGRQIKVLGRANDGSEFIDRARFYDVKPRVYILQCLIPKSLDSPSIATRCDQFFDSFRARKSP
jgi:hypothetical protein